MVLVVQHVTVDDEFAGVVGEVAGDEDAFVRIDEEGVLEAVFPGRRRAAVAGEETAPELRLFGALAAATVASVHRQLGRHTVAWEFDALGLTAADAIPGLDEAVFDCRLGLASDAVGLGELEIAQTELGVAGALVEAHPDWWRQRVRLDWVRAEIRLLADDDFRMDALVDVLRTRLIKRNVPVKNLKFGDREPATHSAVRSTVSLTQGIPADTARRIVKSIKDNKAFRKVTASIQGDEVRVASPSRDELQTVIAALRAEDFGVELKFGNYRS